MVLMKFMKPWIVVSLMVIVSQTAASSQSDTLKTHRVLLVDGSELVGRIVEETAERIFFVTAAGVKVELLRSQVMEVRTIEKEQPLDEDRPS